MRILIFILLAIHFCPLFCADSSETVNWRQYFPAYKKTLKETYGIFKNDLGQEFNKIINDYNKARIEKKMWKDGFLFLWYIKMRFINNDIKSPICEYISKGKSHGVTVDVASVILMKIFFEYSKNETDIIEIGGYKYDMNYLMYEDVQPITPITVDTKIETQVPE